MLSHWNSNYKRDDASNLLPGNTLDFKEILFCVKEIFKWSSKAFEEIKRDCQLSFYLCPLFYQAQIPSYLIGHIYLAVAFSEPEHLPNICNMWPRRMIVLFLKINWCVCTGRLWLAARGAAHDVERITVVFDACDQYQSPWWWRQRNDTKCQRGEKQSPNIVCYEFTC